MTGKPEMITFTACWLIVAGVSVHDAILVLLNDAVMADVEENPLGKWLIDRQAGDVRPFVLLKLVGTAVVCTTLIILFETRRRLALAAVCTLAFLQLTLLAYLSLR